MPFEMDDPSEGGDRRKDMGDNPTTLLPRRVAGTTVCVEVVETEDDDEDEEDGAGEHERGDRDPDVDSNDDDKAAFDSSLDAIA